MFICTLLRVHVHHVHHAIKVQIHHDLLVVFYTFAGYTPEHTPEHCNHNVVNTIKLSVLSACMASVGSLKRMQRMHVIVDRILIFKMFSMESSRSKAYSSEMFNFNGSYLCRGSKEIELNVDPTTVTRTVQLFGTLPSSTQDEFEAVTSAVTSNPSIYLHAYSVASNWQTSAICKLLHKNRFSRKRLTYRALHIPSTAKKKPRA